MKFLCDQMLGTLAKWLRILGYDTYFTNQQISEKKLVDIAKKENRILLTCDKELIYIAKRENITVIRLDTTDLDNQLKIIIKNYKLDDKKFLKRCILCNNIILEIDKNKIKEKVPNGVFEKNENFWFCKKCNKIYWKGTHIEKMKHKIKELTN